MIQRLATGMKPKPDSRLRTDYELEVLLDLDGHEFTFAKNYMVKYEVRRGYGYERPSRRDQIQPHTP